MSRYGNLLAMAAATLVVAGLMSADLSAQSPQAGPAGLWFGIARACTSNSRFPQPPNTVDQAVCRDACQGAACPMSQFPIDEVVMMPELFADGTMVATDHATLVDGHPIGQGRWEYTGKGTIDGKQYDRYQASFMWLQPKQPQDVIRDLPFSIFAGVGRPRFVFYVDPANPDEIKGWIQPFLFAIADQYGVTNLQPGTPYPTPDPLSPLPAVCDPTKQSNPYCFGTLMFVLRRFKIQ
jgi:hypothetical protein